MYEHPMHMKNNIKLDMTEIIYSHIQKQFKDRLQSIYKANVVITKRNYPAFTYKGTYYTIYGTGLSPAKTRGFKLDESLHPIMDEWLIDTDKVTEEEMPYVQGYISQVLNSSKYLPDYLLFLPEVLHEPVIRRMEIYAKKDIGKETKLQPWVIAKILEDNKDTIALMKQRMVLNLIT